MADARVTVSGDLVGVVEERWDGYKRKDGTVAEAGVARSIWLSAGFSHAPTELRVDDVRVFNELAAEAQGTPLAVQCDLRTFVRDGRAFNQFNAVAFQVIGSAA